MVGTSSPRRAAQLLRLRPDLKIVPLARQCRNAAREGRSWRGRCDVACRGRPEAARTSMSATAIPTEDPAARAGPGGDRDRVPHQRHRDAERADDGQQPDHLLARDGRARLHSRARRDLRFAGRGLLPCSRTASCGCAAQIFSEDGSEMVEESAVFDCGDDERPRSWRRACSPRRAAVDPEPVRRAMRRIAGPAPRAGRERDGRARAQARAGRRCDALFEVEPMAWEAPDPQRFRRAAADQRQCGAPWRRAAGAPAHASGPCGRRSDRRRRRARPDSTCEHRRGAASTPCSARSTRTLRLLHLCGEDRRDPADHARTITPIPVYRARALAHVDLRATEGAVVLSTRRAPRGGWPSWSIRRDRPSSIASRRSAGRRPSAAGDGWETVEAAENQRRRLLALAARLCNNAAAT